MNNEHDPIILPDSVATDNVLYERPLTASGLETRTHEAKMKEVKLQSGFPNLPPEDMELFLNRVRWMNKIFELEVNKKPTDLGPVRLLKFYKTIMDEVTELIDCVDNEAFKEHILCNDPFLTESDDPNYIDNIVRDYEDNCNVKMKVNMVALADTLVDLTVYVYSEMIRWGIPIEECSHAVMNSQVTKLDLDGKPLKSPDGAKFIKGPYFQAPEPEIKHILENARE